jgi:hypothetical protein
MGKNKNFNNVVGIFLLILFNIKAINNIELKKNKINIKTKFDIC